MGVIAIIAIVYKLIFGSELNILLILSLCSLSLFYTYLSFIYFNGIPLKKAFQKAQYRGISNWRIIGSIGVGIGLGLTLLGMLWSLMSWPFNTYYEIGLPVLILIGLIIFVKFFDGRSVHNFRILKRVITIGIFGIAFWINPNNAFSKHKEDRVIVEEKPEKEKQEIKYFHQP